jgi:hypothetical protein
MTPKPYQLSPRIGRCYRLSLKHEDLQHSHVLLASGITVGRKPILNLKTHTSSELKLEASSYILARMASPTLVL